MISRDSTAAAPTPTPSTPSSSHFLSRHLAQASLPLAPSLTTNHSGAGGSNANLVNPSARARGSSSATAVAHDSAPTKTLHCEIHPTFSSSADHPGDVLLRVRASPRSNHRGGEEANRDTTGGPSSPQTIDFYCHKDILWFASPFFRTLLQGQWKETTAAVQSQYRPPSSGGASVRTRYDSDEDEDGEDKTAESSSRAHFSEAVNDALARLSFQTAPTGDASSIFSTSGEQEAESIPSEQATPLQRLTRLATPPPESTDARSSTRRGSRSSLTKTFVAPRPSSLSSKHRRRRTRPSSWAKRDARRKHYSISDAPGFGSRGHPALKAFIELPDEDAATVEGALRHVYPHLDLTMTWRNCAPLLAFADKFDICGLRRVCVEFLKASLAGRPILALKIADDAKLRDIYKESSRHVMDAWPAWEPEELAVLSQETLLKLERKRTWFLERLLKLGLASPGRDFLCQPNCPDPDGCARTLQERWQNAMSASFRFGPPTPSSVWRHLRELEGVAPIGSRELAACHNASKAWVTLLFDRMFNLPSGLGPGRGNPKFLTTKLEDG